MLAVQSIGRRRCQAAACMLRSRGVREQRPFQLVAHGVRRGFVSAANNIASVDDNAIILSSKCYSNYTTPTAFHSLNSDGYCQQHRRMFSKFSTDEVVSAAPATATAVESSTPMNTSATTSATTPKPSADLQNQEIIDTNNETAPLQKQTSSATTTTSTTIATRNKKLLIELTQANELFEQIQSKARTLLKSNKASNTSEEVIATIDYFLILVNSLDLERALYLVQSLQLAMHEEGKEKNGDYVDRINLGGEGLKHRQQQQTTEANIEVLGDKDQVRLKLDQAIKSKALLHHMFLTMVEEVLPPLEQQEIQFDEEVDNGGSGSCSGDATPKKRSLHTAMTVGRAMKLSSRAEELRLPMHRPMYQRLAMGIVVTSPTAMNMMTPTSPTSGEVPLVDGDSVKQNSSEGDASTVTAAKVTEDSDTNAAEPTSLIMPGKFQQMEEGIHCPPLSLELLNIYQHARSALNITLQDELEQLAEDLLTKPFLMLLKQKQYEECMGLLRAWSNLFGSEINLIRLMGEHNTLAALDVAKGWLIGEHFNGDVHLDRHILALTNQLEDALSELIRTNKERERNISDLLFQLDLQKDVDEYDGGIDFDVKFETDSDFDDDDYGSDEKLDTPTPTDGVDCPTPTGVYQTKKSNDGSTTTLNFTPKQQEKDDGESSTIIRGLTDNEARQSIYLRGGELDFVLPDIVSHLEEWNKGKPLTFTPEFERYLGRQIMKEERDDLDDD